MIGIVLKLIGLIPAPLRIWAALALAAIVISTAWSVYASIERRGFDRCKAAYEAEANKQAEDARAEIIKTGDRYEKIKAEISGKSGGNLPVSPLISDAIDRLPNP